MDTYKLTETELLQALEDYTAGASSSSIAAKIIDQHDLDQNEKKQIITQLRSANPNDQRFNKKKYADIYESMRALLVEELCENVRLKFSTSFESVSDSISELDELSRSIKGLVLQARNQNIDSNHEFNQTIKTLMSVELTRLKAIEKLSLMLDKMIIQSEE